MSKLNTECCVSRLIIKNEHKQASAKYLQILFYSAHKFKQKQFLLDIEDVTFDIRNFTHILDIIYSIFHENTIITYDHIVPLGNYVIRLNFHKQKYQTIISNNTFCISYRLKDFAQKAKYFLENIIIDYQTKALIIARKQKFEILNAKRRTSKADYLIP